MGHSDEKVGDVCVFLCGYIYIIYTYAFTHARTYAQKHKNTHFYVGPALFLNCGVGATFVPFSSRK